MVILDKLLREVDVWLGLRGLPLITYLFLGFMFNLAPTLALIAVGVRGKSTPVPAMGLCGVLEYVL
jgi:hypothetical protein